jgi:hypothetical protein
MDEKVHSNINNKFVVCCRYLLLTKKRGKEKEEKKNWDHSKIELYVRRSLLNN